MWSNVSNNNKNTHVDVKIRVSVDTVDLVIAATAVDLLFVLEHGGLQVSQDFYAHTTLRES